MFTSRETQKQSRRSTARLRQLLLLLALTGLLPALTVRSSSAQTHQDDTRRRTQEADAPTEEKAFHEAREALADERWARAEERFSDFISDYPQSRSVAAALYWLAFALQKQQRFGEADKVLERLVREFPSSSWTGDAQAMRVELAARMGRAGMLAEEAGRPTNDEAKLVALRALFKTDPERALERASEVFRQGGDASQSFKESVIMLLGRYAGLRAAPLLTDIARDNAEPELRKAAIFWMGRSGDEHVLETLREFALSSADTELALASLSAILQHGSQRAIEYIGEIADSAKSDEVRRQARAVLGTAAGAATRNMKGAWLLIKEENQLLVIPGRRVIRIAGGGELQFKQDGRVIELPRGASLTVDGRPVFREHNVGAGETVQVVGDTIVSRERVVREAEVVRIVAPDGSVMWELSLGPEAGASTSDDDRSPVINGNFTISSKESKTFVLHPVPGGGVRLQN